MMVGKGIEDIDVAMPRDTYNTDKDTPTFNAYLTVVVRDSEGKVVRVHRQRSRSPTANFIGLLLPILYYANTGSAYTIKNTGGSTYSYQPAVNNSANCIPYPNTNNNPAVYLVMIQVGSGQQSNPYTAYTLASPIANGSGAGQLVYGQPSIPSNITVSGSTAYFTISQTFNNNSGSTVTITEVGIITKILLYSENGNTASSVGNTLVWYDVLSSSISVANGGSVTIYYTFTVNP
jgi:hypothetical protein